MNYFDRDLNRGNLHYSSFLTPPRFSPRSFHPLDDNDGKVELKRLAYLEKNEKQASQQIDEFG